MNNKMDESFDYEGDTVLRTNLEREKPVKKNSDDIIDQENQDLLDQVNAYLKDKVLRFEGFKDLEGMEIVDDESDESTSMHLKKVIIL
jgi:hypothetical protein